MIALHDTLSSVWRTIIGGPDALEGAVYKGPPERTLLGLKAHANTVSHARLVALEETFPLTRDAFGAAKFNALSRTYVDGGKGCAVPLAQIGATFPSAMTRADVDKDLVLLAHYEWAWLGAFHAAEAAPMTLMDVDASKADKIMSQKVERHPAARMVANSPIIPGNHPGDMLLITRPEESVLVCGLNPVETTLCVAAGAGETLMNTVIATFSAHPSGDVESALLKLIAVGALCAGKEVK